MKFHKGFRIEYKNPTPIEFINIRNTTGWSKLGEETIEKGLEKSLFSICLYHNDNLVGMGRIVGDDSIYFYIQDIIIVPEYKGQGLGTLIMNEIMKYLEANANCNSFIGLMAADGVEGFYHKFGFKARPNSMPGMYSIHRKKR